MQIHLSLAKKIKKDINFIEYQQYAFFDLNIYEIGTSVDFGEIKQKKESGGSL